MPEERPAALDEFRGTGFVEVYWDFGRKLYEGAFYFAHPADARRFGEAGRRECIFEGDVYDQYAAYGRSAVSLRRFAVLAGEVQEEGTRAWVAVYAVHDPASGIGHDGYPLPVRPRGAS